MRTLKFYTDRKFIPHSSVGHVHFLFPWWGSLVEEIYKNHSVYERYVAVAGESYQPVNELADADFAVLPANFKYYKKWNRADLVEELVSQCREHGKKLLVFFKDDSDEDLNLDIQHTIVFRTSFYMSQCKANEHAMPVWSGDLVDVYGNGDFRAASLPDKFRLGFCGQTLPNVNVVRRAWQVFRFRLALLLHSARFTSAKDFGKRWFSFLRSYALEVLRRGEQWECDFIERTDYLGGAWLRKGSFDLNRYGEIRNEYVANLQRNDFFPCVRGGGNYSMRLYEVLSLGKIPILIDTDSVMPFPDRIDWNRHVVVVPCDSVANINKLLQAAVSNLTHDEFVAWQKRNRELWLEYLSPEGFFRNMASILTDQR